MSVSPDLPSKVPSTSSSQIHSLGSDIKGKTPLKKRQQNLNKTGSQDVEQSERVTDLGRKNISDMVTQDSLPNTRRKAHPGKNAHRKPGSRSVSSSTRANKVAQDAIAGTPRVRKKAHKNPVSSELAQQPIPDSAQKREPSLQGLHLPINTAGTDSLSRDVKHDSLSRDVKHVRDLSEFPGKITRARRLEEGTNSPESLPSTSQSELQSQKLQSQNYRKFYSYSNFGPSKFSERILNYIEEVSQESPDPDYDQAEEFDELIDIIEAIQGEIILEIADVDDKWNTFEQAPYYTKLSELRRRVPGLNPETLAHPKINWEDLLVKLSKAVPSSIKDSEVDVRFIRSIIEAGHKLKQSKKSPASVGLTADKYYLEYHPVNNRGVHYLSIKEKAEKALSKLEKWKNDLLNFNFKYCHEILEGYRGAGRSIVELDKDIALYKNKIKEIGQFLNRTNLDFFYPDSIASAILEKEKFNANKGAYYGGDLYSGNVDRSRSYGGTIYRRPAGSEELVSELEDIRNYLVKGPRVENSVNLINFINRILHGSYDQDQPKNKDHVNTEILANIKSLPEDVQREILGHLHLPYNEPIPVEDNEPISDEGFLEPRFFLREYLENLDSLSTIRKVINMDQGQGYDLLKSWLLINNIHKDSPQFKALGLTQQEQKKLSRVGY